MAPHSRTIEDLTVEEVNEQLVALATESPDFQYNSRHGTASPACHYDAACGGGEGPGCIFGQAFELLGVNVSEIGSGNIREVWEVGFEEADPHPKGTCPPAWSDIQDDQDTGRTWGEAIKNLSPTILSGIKCQESQPVPGQ